MPGQPQSARYFLESRRLLLRQMTPNDAEFLFSIFGDPVVMTYYPAPSSRAEVQAAIQRNLDRYANDGFGLWVVERKDSGQPIGDCGLIRQDLPAGSEVEIGYHFHPDHWGQGFATEAANRCMTYAFEVLKLPRVISLIRPENGPSRRVAERNGMSITGELERIGLRHFVYGIAHEDWAARRPLPR